MNRKSINFVTITLYIVFLVGAILFGYLNHTMNFPTWIVSLICLGAMFIVGIVRSCLLAKDKKNYINTNTTRVVSVKATRIEGNISQNNLINEELPLVHVDNVDPNKLVISIHKNKALLTDSVGKVINE